jgi:hypothetical protein
MSLIWFAVAFVAICVIFDIYTRLPARFRVAPLRPDPATRSLVLLFHGRRGENEATLLALEKRLKALAGSLPGITVLLYTWAPYSDPRFRCQQNAQHIGEALGVELAALPRLDSLHLIGQSAGAYLLDPLGQAYRRAGGRARIVMTYLDPQGFRGGFDPLWGARHYGACADYAEVFINTDDRAMGTNTFLRHAWNVDVTSAAKPPGYADGGHRWPLRYYLDNIGAEDLLAAAYAHSERPRGAVVTVGAASAANDRG